MRIGRIHPEAVLEVFVVLIAAVGVSAFLTWPLVVHLGDRIYGLGGDSTGTIAWLRSMANGPGFDVIGVRKVMTAGAPFGYEQGNGVNMTVALVYFPAYLLAELGADVVAYNLVVLSGLAFSGAAMYWLVRRLGVHPLSAAWAGLVFIVFPWHLEKAQGHAAFTHLEGFPLLVLAVLAWRDRPTIPRAVLVVAATAVLWTTSGYFGLIAVVALAVLLPLTALSHRRRLGTGRALRRLVLVSGGVLAVAASVRVITSLGSTDAGVSAARGAGELQTYGARPWEFLIPSPKNPLFGDDFGHWLLAHLHGSNLSETSLYVGWITIVLAGGWLVWALARRARLSSDLAFATVALVALTVTGLVFSLPSPLPRTDVPTPVRLLWELAPQFRVPSRFVTLVVAGLIPLAALGLERVRHRLATRAQAGSALRLAAGGLCVVVAALSVLELSISSVPITDLGTPRPEYAAVRKAPAGLLAEYPLASGEHGVTSDYLFWQRAHGRRLVNGAPPGTFSDAVRQTLVDPATPGTAKTLAALGVSVIVVRANTYAFTGSSLPPPANLGAGYRLLARTGTATVWEVVAEPAVAIAAFTQGFGPAETPPGQPASRWMVEKTGSIKFYAPRSGTYLAEFFASSYAQPRLLRLDGQTSSIARHVASGRVEVPVSLPRGLSALSITTAPGPERLPDGRSASIYFSNWTFRPIRGERVRTLQLADACFLEHRPSCTPTDEQRAWGGQIDAGAG
jgi:hypothetical protein